MNAEPNAGPNAGPSAVRITGPNTAWVSGSRR
jgi:hypothetical protein